MRRKLYLGTMGGPKAGKTHFALTLFTSKYVNPERILYFDNHGSTDTYAGIPQYTNATRYGVVHLDPLNPEDLLNKVRKLRVDWKRGIQRYDAVVVDDWSEYAQYDSDDRLSAGDETSVPRAWGKHGDVMRETARILHPTVCGAHHIAIFQAAQLPSPLEKRPQDFTPEGHPKFTMDTRPTKLRPFLQGSFASWFPYKLDAVFYQYMERRKGGFEFKLQLAPDAKVEVLSRWLTPWVDNPKRPSVIDDPTFDKVWETILGFEPTQTVSEEQTT